jgi:hypothetical protein
MKWFNDFGFRMDFHIGNPKVSFFIHDRNFSDHQPLLSLSTLTAAVARWANSFSIVF